MKKIIRCASLLRAIRDDPFVDGDHFRRIKDHIEQIPPARILPTCPVCGRLPRLKLDFGVTESGYRLFLCQVRCKPVLQKTHLTVAAMSLSEDGAVTEAVEAWAELAEYVP